MAAPTSTSDGKCCFAPIRATLTVLAIPYARNFMRWTGIFVGHDSGNRPDCGGVFRRKRATAFPELSIAIVLIGALASGHKFEGLHRDQAVDGRFPTEKARFALVLVMGHEPQKVRASRSSDHGVRAVI